MLNSADVNQQGNAKFAVAVDESNEKLQQRKQSIDAAREKVSAFRPKPLSCSCSCPSSSPSPFRRTYTHQQARAAWPSE